MLWLGDRRRNKHDAAPKLTGQRHDGSTINRVLVFSMRFQVTQERRDQCQRTPKKKARQSDHRAARSISCWALCFLTFRRQPRLAKVTLALLFLSGNSRDRSKVRPKSCLSFCVYFKFGLFFWSVYFTRFNYCSDTLTQRLHWEFVGLTNLRFFFRQQRSFGQPNN